MYVWINKTSIIVNLQSNFHTGNLHKTKQCHKCSLVTPPSLLIQTILLPNSSKYLCYCDVSYHAPSCNKKKIAQYSNIPHQQKSNKPEDGM